MHRKIACAHVPVWFVKMSNWLSDPKESSIVYRDVIFISTKQKVSIVCEMIRPINVCVKRKAVVIRKLIHRWYQSYENTLPNTIRNSTNWLARIWDGQRNKKRKNKRMHTTHTQGLPMYYTAGSRTMSSMKQSINQTNNSTLIQRYDTE